MFLHGHKNTKRAFDLFTHQFPCCCCDCLEIKMQHIESTQKCKNEQKKRKEKENLTFWFFVFTSHSECSAVVLFSRSTCDLSLAAWPVGQTPQGQFIGRQKAEETQLTGRGPPTRNQPSFPHTHTYGHPHTSVASDPLSVYLPSTQEMSAPSSLIYGVFMQSVVMHVITLCGGFYLPVVLSPAPARVKTGSLWAPVCVCVFSGRTCIFKTQP